MILNMEQNRLILFLITGCVVSIIGFFLAQYLLTLMVIGFIILVFLYSDFKTWRDSTKEDYRKLEQRVAALEKK
jgi:uncharacterized membrane protein YfcA